MVSTGTANGLGLHASRAWKRRGASLWKRAQCNECMSGCTLLRSTCASASPLSLLLALFPYLIHVCCACRKPIAQAVGRLEGSRELPSSLEASSDKRGEVGRRWCTWALALSTVWLRFSSGLRGGSLCPAMCRVCPFQCPSPSQPGYSLQGRSRNVVALSTLSLARSVVRAFLWKGLHCHDIWCDTSHSCTHAGVHAWGQLGSCVAWPGPGRGGTGTWHRHAARVCHS